MTAALPPHVLAFLVLALMPRRSTALREVFPACTPEEEIVYRQFGFSSLSPSCDWTTFKTCTDGCLAGLQTAAQHVPNCSDSSVILHTRTYLGDAEQELEACEEARANSTNKYFPHVVVGTSTCTEEELTAWYTKEETARPCTRRARVECTDDCLKSIEDLIATGPGCATGSVYTLGEDKKYALVECLLARNEDLTSSKTLQTITPARPSEQSGSPTSALLASTVVGVMGTLVLLHSVV